MNDNNKDNKNRGQGWFEDREKHAEAGKKGGRARSENLENSRQENRTPQERGNYDSE